MTVPTSEATTMRTKTCEAENIGDVLLSSLSESPSQPQRSLANIDTRERWLTELMYLLSYYMEEKQPETCAQIADWRVSCSWPGGGSSRKRIGECWSTTASKNGRTEMFISPMLDDTIEVAATLLHEMVHASVGVKEKHNSKFGKLARKLGLEGKLTATVAGEDLTKKLTETLKLLPEYPHAGLTLSGGDLKKQSTRMMKCRCVECGYIVRTTKVWIEKGLPTCVCGGEFEIAS